MLEKIIWIPILLPWLFASGFIAILTRSFFLPRDDLKTPRILWGVEAFWNIAKTAYFKFTPWWPSDDDIRKEKREWKHDRETQGALAIVRVWFAIGSLGLWGMLFGVWDA